MIDFNDPKLVSKYGSWVRVQVEFFDFLFLQALELCPKHFKEKLVDGLAFDEFQDGADFYEQQVKSLERYWGEPTQAWEEFKRLE